MSNIHYFPRYTQKENQVTNNTLLMMKQLYDFHRLKFGKFIAGLTDEVEVPTNFDLQFSQQEGTGGSVVDGCITQESIKIVVETKRYGGNFDGDQLVRHLGAFGQEDHQILVMLGPQQEDVPEMLRTAIDEMQTKPTVLCTTFADIIESMRQCLSEHDEEMRDILEDFVNFCSEMDLLPRDKFTMFTPPCRDTLDANMRYNIYYCPADRSIRNVAYLGIYANKSVRKVGKIAKIVTCDVDDESIVGKPEIYLSNELSEDERNRIVAIIKDTHGPSAHGLKFYLCDSMAETDFEKTSSGGIQGHRYRDLGEALGEPLPDDIEEIGKRLRDKTWA